MRPSVEEINSKTKKKSCISIPNPRGLMSFTKVIGTPNRVFGVVARPRAGWIVVRIPVKERDLFFKKILIGFGAKTVSYSLDIKVISGV
jgi:hypothetical protein